jgi:glycosyltransferase involved in cell wall biosynthesis
VQDYYQAMDVFLFPSINEGFGMAAIEAQAAGLPVVASIHVPRDIKLTDMVSFLPLKNVEIWADTLLSFRACSRTGHAREVREAGYDIKKISEELRAIYVQS